MRDWCADGIHLDRLLTQIERILEINSLQTVTKAIAPAARESLVIGH
jgi:hypothetical protein